MSTITPAVRRILLHQMAIESVRGLARNRREQRIKVYRQNALADAMGELAKMMLAEQEGDRNADRVQA